MRINGSLLTDALTIADLTASGPIGSASATVDRASFFVINQTTAGVDISVPVPTMPRNGRHCYIFNGGTSSFTSYGKTVDPGDMLVLFFAAGAWRTQADPPVTSTWTSVTGNIVAAVDGQYKIMGAHEITFPATPAANATVRMVPGNSNWLALGHSFATTDGATIASGQIGAISATNAGAELLWMYEPPVGSTPANWRVFA